MKIYSRKEEEKSKKNSDLLPNTKLMHKTISNSASENS